MDESILVEECDIETGGSTESAVPCLVEALEPFRLADLDLLRLKKYRLFCSADYKESIDYTSLITWGEVVHRILDLRVYDSWPETARHVEVIMDDLPAYLVSGFEVNRKSTLQDEYGEEVISWALQTTVDGYLRQLSGDKRFVAATHGYDADYQLFVLSLEDALVGDVVVYDGKNYEVRNVDNVMEAGNLMRLDLLWLSTPPLEDEP